MKLTDTVDYGTVASPSKQEVSEHHSPDATSEHNIVTLQ
jgi:hypothetical protein